MRKIILSGGGNDIFRILENFSAYGIYDGQNVGYMAIAAEPNTKLINKIKEGFNKIDDYIVGFGANSSKLILSDNINDSFECDTLIISGGSTDYLISVLINNDYAMKLEECDKVKNIIGISAGAIALSQKGVGTKQGNEHLYNGLAIADCNVVPHSDEEKKQKYPEMMHIDEYGIEVLNAGKVDK
jgi:peptidase E